MKKWLSIFMILSILLSFVACGKDVEDTTAPTDTTVTEATVPTDTQVPETTEAACDTAVFHIQTDAIRDENGRWLVDAGVGDYHEATDTEVSFEENSGWFEGTAISMPAKANADFNLFWQVDPEGVYAVNTGLNTAEAKLTLWLYVEDIDMFYESNWTEVDIGSGGWFGEKWANWQLKDEYIYEGWNYLEFKISEADENTGVDLSNLRWFRFCFTGAPEGTVFRVGDINLVSVPASEDDPVVDPTPVGPEPVDLTGKTVFHVQTDTIRDDAGRWLVDFGVGDFKEATEADVTFAQEPDVFEGSSLSMLAKPNADYNLFWQVDPEGLYNVDTQLDSATAGLSMWIYISDISTFYNTGWSEIDIGSGGWFGESWARWQLTDERLTSGWNYIVFRLADADENTGVDLSALRWFRFCYTGAAEGTEFRIADINLFSDPVS